MVTKGPKSEEKKRREKAKNVKLWVQAGSRPARALAGYGTITGPCQAPFAVLMGFLNSEFEI